MHPEASLPFVRQGRWVAETLADFRPQDSLSHFIHQWQRARPQMGKRDRAYHREWAYTLVRWWPALQSYWKEFFQEDLQWNVTDIAAGTAALSCWYWHWPDESVAAVLPRELQRRDELLKKILITKERTQNLWSYEQKNPSKTMEYGRSWGFSQAWSQALQRSCPSAEEWTKLLPTLQSLAPMTLAVHPRFDLQSLSLKEASPCELSKISFLLKADARLPAETRESPFFRVQDEGSTILALLTAHSCELEKQPHNVLDLCAGTGGKSQTMTMVLPEESVTFHLWDAERYDQLLSSSKNWKSPHFRMTALNQNPDWEEFKQFFNLVLCDVPCSGSGTLRRHPEIRLRNHEELIRDAQKKQLSILNRAAALVQPGGYLLYATCSLFTEENQEQISCFLDSHPEFTRSPWETSSPWMSESRPLSFPCSEITLLPKENAWDGYYLCRLRRNKDRCLT